MERADGGSEIGRKEGRDHRPSPSQEAGKQPHWLDHS